MYHKQKQEKRHFNKTLRTIWNPVNWGIHIQIISVPAYEVQISGYWVRGWVWVSYSFMNAKFKQNKVTHYKQNPIAGQ